MYAFEASKHIDTPFKLFNWYHAKSHIVISYGTNPCDISAKSSFRSSNTFQISERLVDEDMLLMNEIFLYLISITIRKEYVFWQSTRVRRFCMCIDHLREWKHLWLKTLGRQSVILQQNSYSNILQRKDICFGYEWWSFVWLCPWNMKHKVVAINKYSIVII